MYPISLSVHTHTHTCIYTHVLRLVRLHITSAEVAMNLINQPIADRRTSAILWKLIARYDWITWGSFSYS